MPNSKVRSLIKISKVISIPEVIDSQFTDQSSVHLNLMSKILVVDDEKANCDLIVGLLLVLGVANRKAITDFAYNGNQAVKMVQQAFEQTDPLRYKLILMDCYMPSLDGFEATKKIRQLFNDSNIAKENQPMICAITGNVEEDHKQRALKSGMDRVFLKPLPIEDLKRVLKKQGFLSASVAKK